MELVKSYLRAHKIKLLSKDDVYDLIGKAQKGCIKSRDLVVVHNVPLVLSISSKYYYAGTSIVEFDDLFQEGVIGLMRAVELFDIQRGLEFSTYADPWIKQRIRRCLDDNKGPVRTPIWMLELKRKYAKMKKDDHPHTDDFYIRLVARQNNTSVSNLRHQITQSPTDVRIDDPFDTHQLESIVDEDKLNVSLMDFEMMLNKLDKQEKFIIERRMSDWTLAQISKVENLSRERIRQIEEQAIRKLKAMVTDVKNYDVFDVRHKIKQEFYKNREEMNKMKYGQLKEKVIKIEKIEKLNRRLEREQKDLEEDRRKLKT